ncbi:hypothetical protein [Amycolatopsis magusensis]|uniref:Mce-associated membrane protein n=1 Tax=Amycolatopsis magusensis TaxID=882444 RepID=A0ABS4PM24_9PSEU|nr:hypothetical protein [Amycolatopsis magusensis]MBP2180388.1 Mce-associated membrane protein [Amycolatopsis magusensis]
MANRRQPPRPGSTPVRRPKVAGIRRPGAESEPQTPSRPSPKPRPEPEVVEAPSSAAAAEPVVEEEAVVEPVSEPVSEPVEPDAPVVKAKPSPRPKARDTGVPKPTSEAEAEEVPEPAFTQVVFDQPKRPSRLLLPLLLVAAVAFAGLAVWFKIEESEVSAATDNTALLDVAKTAQVKQAVTSAAEALFSYDFNDIAKTENAANELLVNDEVRQKYNGFMGEVKRLAPEQKMVVTMKVTRSAVVLIDGDRAKVMVSADQTSTRTAQNQTSAGGAQMWFTTELRDGKWKITDLNTYSGGQPAQPTTPPPAPTAPPTN